jgi:hypothetical protein
LIDRPDLSTDQIHPNSLGATLISKRVYELIKLNSENRVSNAYIANKYAIPFLQVGQLHYIETFFYYQHDSKVWLISFKEETTDYFG